MIITQLEGKVSTDNWEILSDAFEDTLERVPSAIDASYLVQDKGDHEVWRVITIWRSKSALEDYRQSVETPEGVLMFRKAGAEPTLTMGNVVIHT